MVGVEPAFEGAAVEIFAGDGEDVDFALSFDVFDNWVGNEVFLVAGAEMIGVIVIDDAL